MNKDMEMIGRYGILPILTMENSDDAIPVAKSIKEAGIPVVEVTFRTAAAEMSIKNICKAYPEMIIGAGTILTIESARRAVDAGARFLLSPGLNPKVVEYCVNKDICIIPGCSCPTDIEIAMDFGLDVLKIFPIEPMGGIKMFKSMTAPYRGIKYIPTGGINAYNMTEYLAMDKVLACGGSWIGKPESIRNGQVKEATTEAVQHMLGFEFAHLGINSKSADEAKNITGKLYEAFGFLNIEGNSSIFASQAIEVVKGIGFGECGHFAVRTNDLTRAVIYLKDKGFDMDEGSTKTNAAGKKIAVYLKDQISGFAVHLLQK